MTTEGYPGTVHWIDHAVLGTNDLNAWVEWAVNAIGATPQPMVGLTTAARRRNQPVFIFMTIGDGSCHFGAFLQREDLPPRAGLGKDTPRYGFFIRPEDVRDHLRRLDAHGIPHTDPLRTAAEGDAGTAIRFEDPDGNQFEFWAPDRMPAGAMEVRTDLGVGRISSAVYGSRDLRRTAAFFERFCELRRVDSPEVPEDSLVLRLEGGARLVYNLVDEVEERRAGHAQWTGLHAALTLREHEFFPTYERMWDGIPEEDQITNPDGSSDQEDELPARTAAHGSPTGRKWKKLYQRGDEFYDWDGHAFHFVGGTPLDADGSLALYRPKESGEYLEELEARANSPA